jgi:hydrogenase expression/formation protein HypC
MNRVSGKASIHREAPNFREMRMCLGIPGKVVEVFIDNEVPMGKVDFGGIRKQVCLAHTPDVRPGSYVIVHVGFSLQVLDEQEANLVFSFLERMNELGELTAEETSDETPAASSREATPVGADSGHRS